MAVSVLVVEDQHELRAAVVVLLEREGYEVHGAASPEDALELLKSLPRPCILLWDALMPRESLSLVSAATLRGVHVATLPVGVARGAHKVVKRLTSGEAVLNVVRKYCPLRGAANG